MRAKLVLKDVGVGKNDAKTQATQEYFLACPKVKLRSRRL
jgi:hypothetical protein